jgi:CheY-like chemotaxis protein
MAVQGDGMETTIQRRVPLVVVTGREETAALVECLRAQGAVVYQARTPAGCLRVATAVRPDVILLPRGFPRRVARLLRQHPTSAGARIVWLTQSADDMAAVADLVQLASLPDESQVAEGVGQDEPMGERKSRELGRLTGQLAGEGPAHA